MGCKLVGTTALFGTIDKKQRLSGMINVIPVSSESIKLQEKTVTKNGDVVPDSDYDGLSKVTVNVVTKPSLQDISVSENGVYSADSGFDGLGKVTVDVPIIDASEGTYYRNLKFTQAFAHVAVLHKFEDFSCTCSVTI